MLIIQGQLSNNIGACVCLYVVDATSCSSERFFGCRLGRKEIEKRREKKNGKEKKENIFATACLLAFDSRRRLVKKGEEKKRKTEEQKKGALAPRPIGHRSTDQYYNVEIE
jgi:hypothetical protein